MILMILLLQLFETSGISLMADSQYNGETRVQVLLEYLQVSHIRNHNYRAVCLTNLIHVTWKQHLVLSLSLLFVGKKLFKFLTDNMQIFLRCFNKYK